MLPGLDPQAVHIYIVNDPTLNSFVAGGQNLFLNTGTLMRSESPNQIVGIMAHETGHIAGGHLARSEAGDAQCHDRRHHRHGGRAAAAAAGHSPDAGAAAILGGSGVAQRSFLSFSIAQEASADHAALTFLDRTHQSARGLLQFFHILEQEELLSGNARGSLPARPSPDAATASTMCRSMSTIRRGRTSRIRPPGS